jgi:hypothetical protein
VQYAYLYIYAETTALLIKCFESHRFWKYLSGKMVPGKRDEAHIHISPILKTSVFQNVGDQRGIGRHPTSALTECDTVAYLTLKKKMRKCESGMTMS